MYFTSYFIKQDSININNSTINEKGVNDWISTINPLVNLFTSGIKQLPDSYLEFEKIFNIVIYSLEKEPEYFIKVLKFYHLIQNRNKIKWLYYLCALVLKFYNIELYEKILDLSWQYPKDYMNLHRLTNMFEPVHTDETVQITIPEKPFAPGSYAHKLNAWVRQNNVTPNVYGQKSNVHIQIELVHYGKHVFDLLKNLLNPEFNGEYNPMFLKYMSYEKGHWEVETQLIWQYVEKLVDSDDDFKNLIKSELPLKTNLGNELRNILKKSLNSNKLTDLFTNKTRRLLKKCFNSYINSPYNLFKGEHQKGEKFIFCELSEVEEINKIDQQLKKSPTLTFAKFEKKVKKYPEFIKLRYNNENKDFTIQIKNKVWEKEQIQKLYKVFTLNQPISTQLNKGCFNTENYLIEKQSKKLSE